MALYVQLRVLSASNLPKTDTFSKIDPYFSFTINGAVYKTSQKDDNDNPVWNENFMLECPATSNGLPKIETKLELYDQDTFKDSNIGSAHLDTSQVDPAHFGLLELPIVVYKAKYQKQGKVPVVRVAIVGWVHSYGLLRSYMAQTPGVQCNDHERRLYVPFPNSPALYLGVEYDAGGVDCKVFITQPNSGLFVDMVYAGKQGKTKIRRRTYKNGKQIWQGITAFEEVKIDDVPLNADFNQLMVMVSQKSLLMSTGLDKIVKDHGWKGMLDFHSATKFLHGVDFDMHEQEIYIPVEAPPSETLLLVDYDNDNVDIKLAILHTGSTADKGYDLTIDKQDCGKSSEVFLPPAAKLNGRYHVSRIFELDDVEYGTSFSDMKVYKYQLANTTPFSIQSLVMMRPL